MCQKIYRNTLTLFAVIFTIIFLIPSAPVYGATNYRVQGEIPKYSANDFKEDEQARQMATIKITASTKDAFSTSGETYRAEFRLPRDFYITSAGYYDPDNPKDVEIERGKGFEDLTRQVEINLIAEERHNPGHYRGFELVVGDIVRPDDYPELILHFNRVVIPRGFKGQADVKVDSEAGGFSEGSFAIASIQSARLDVVTSEVQYLVGGEQKLGPIKISENMAATFEYINLILPGGYVWNAGSCYIDPMLGFRRDLNGDGRYDERDFVISVQGDKYGQSVLHIELLNTQRTTTIGKMEIECNIDMEDRSVSFGDVNLRLESNADLNTSSLKVATFSQSKVNLTAENVKDVYGGLCAQQIGDIMITENAPETLFDNRDITVTLPDGAKWAILPSVQLEGDNYLDTSPLRINNDKDRISFDIEASSLDRPGKIRLKEGKVDLATDFQGDLTVSIGGSAGASGTVSPARTKTAVTATAASTPALLIGQQQQAAGDIEIAETAGRNLLSGELWVDFPDGVILERTPQVTVSGGDLKISRLVLDQDRPRSRLIIPVTVSSSQASKISIKDISYNLKKTIPDGEMKVRIGGPAVNEVNQQVPALFPNREWVCEISNATGRQDDTVGKAPSAASITATFKVGEKAYQANGLNSEMDVAPFIQDGRTFIPVRYAALALGIDPANIIWDEADRRVTINHQDKIIQLTVGENAVYCNGNRLSADASIQVKDGRTIVPLRAMAEAFGVNVNWDAATMTITLSQ